MVDIKANLRRALKRRRFSRSAAAKEAGISGSTFSAWLGDDTEEIGAIKLLKVLYALQITVNELFEDHPVETGKTVATANIATPPDLAGKPKRKGKPAAPANGPTERS
jgi:transcriptional regulator with XRE-family HTH domain